MPRRGAASETDVPRSAPPPSHVAAAHAERVFLDGDLGSGEVREIARMRTVSRQFVSISHSSAQDVYQKNPRKRKSLASSQQRAKASHIDIQLCGECDRVLLCVIALGLFFGFHPGYTESCKVSYYENGRPTPTYLMQAIPIEALLRCIFLQRECRSRRSF